MILERRDEGVLITNGGNNMNYERYVKKEGEKVGRLESVSPMYNRDGEEIHSHEMYQSSIKAIDDYGWDLYFATGEARYRPDSGED